MPPMRICAGSASAGRKAPTKADPTRLTCRAAADHLSGRVAQAAATRLYLSLPLFTQGSRVRIGAPHERISAMMHGSLGVGTLGIEDDEPLYPGTCRPAEAEKAELSARSDSALPNGCNWRFRVPDGASIEFVDRNLGPQRFVAGSDFGDFVVWRRDGSASYQLACVADDAAMGITEVVRGADLLQVHRAPDAAQSRARLSRSRMVPLPACGGPQWQAAGEAARLVEPARPAPARPDAHEYSVGGITGGRLEQNFRLTVAPSGCDRASRRGRRCGSRSAFPPQ